MAWSLFKQFPQHTKEGLTFPPPTHTHTKQKQKEQLKLKTPKTILRKPKEEKEENKQEKKRLIRFLKIIEK